MISTQDPKSCNRGPHLSYLLLTVSNEKMRHALTAQCRAIVRLELKAIGKRSFELIQLLLEFLTSLPYVEKTAFLASVNKTSGFANDLGELCHAYDEIVFWKLNGDVLFED